VSGKIFINYRRKQSRDAAGRLFDALSKKFPGRVFFDLDGVKGFSDWFEALTNQVDGAAAMISVIGKDWLSVLDAKDYPAGETTKDFVRFEIVEALRRNIPVLPVLLDGAAMPAASELPLDMQSMVRWQGMDLHAKRFAEDSAAITRELGRLLKEAENGKGLAPWKAAALSAAAFAVGVAAGPSMLTRLGVIEPITDAGLRAELKDARERAKTAASERDRAAEAKDKAGNDLRAATETAASETSKREAAEARAALAASDLKVAEQRLQRAKTVLDEVREAKDLAASEKSKREAAESLLAEAASKLKAAKLAEPASCPEELAGKKRSLVALRQTLDDATTKMLACHSAQQKLELERDEARDKAERLENKYLFGKKP
jgi:hypothetical protein